MEAPSTRREEFAPLEAPEPTTEIVETPIAARRGARVIIGQLLRSKTFVVGALVLLFWIFDALFWPWIVPHDPQALFSAHTLQPPSWRFWFGTDDMGRDVFSRVLAGASSTLTIAPAGTALGVTGGILIGLMTGYHRGALDEIVMRIIDALLAFPLIVIAVLVMSMLGSSATNVILVIGIIFTPYVTRTVRAAVLVEREHDYVAAAKLLGNSSLHIMFVEILPNILGPIAVEVTIRLGYAIFTSATLSFLALGVQQPSPDWGLSISLGRAYLEIAPWEVLFPAAALATLIVSVNLVADALRQVFDE